MPAAAIERGVSVRSLEPSKTGLSNLLSPVRVL